MLLENLQKITLQPRAYLELPENPGVYIYFKKGQPIYVGKAINLKRRVSSYFSLDLEAKTAKLMADAEQISYIKVASEFEALLLEAKLIKQYLPKYNIQAKDDKHPLYIVITKEEYPRVLAARKLISNFSPLISSYGPFPSSRNVYSVLKMIRRIFPFSDHKIGKRKCLYAQIGLCEPCPNGITGIKNLESRIRETKRYKQNIRHIKAILDGKIEKVQKEIEKEMKVASDNQDFETAVKLRNKIQNLAYITRPQMPTEFYIENPNLYEDQRKIEIDSLRRLIGKWKLEAGKLRRIECFDVAHLSGTAATASMVTFINGEADKKYYRHFRIRQIKKGSDIDSLREVITRRLKNIEAWGKPDLIIVDGGAGQVNVFTEVLQKENINIPVAGIAKHPDRLIIDKDKIKLSGAPLNLVAKIRDEAHRFARVYHHKLLKRSLFEAYGGK